VSGQVHDNLCAYCAYSAQFPASSVVVCNYGTGVREYLDVWPLRKRLETMKQAAADGHGVEVDNMVVGVYADVLCKGSYVCLSHLMEVMR
jgi:hypothetical protein